MKRCFIILFAVYCFFLATPSKSTAYIINVINSYAPEYHRDCLEVEWYPGEDGYLLLEYGMFIEPLFPSIFIIPEDGDSANAMATISFTRIVERNLSISMENINYANFSYDPSDIPDSIVETYSLPVNQLIELSLSTYPYDCADISLNELPTPIIDSEFARLYISSSYTINGTIELLSVAPIPEPTTIVLFLIGISQIGILGKRKFSKSN